MIVKGMEAPSTPLSWDVIGGISGHASRGVKNNRYILHDGRVMLTDELPIAISSEPLYPPTEENS